MKISHYSQVRSLAINVWLEALRDRIVLVLTGSGIIMLFFSMILGNMSVGGQDRVIQNMGLWVLGTWGLLAVVYIGSNIIRQELEKRTIYLILSRPVNRSTFIIGKFFGMLLILATIFILLLCCWVFIMMALSIPVTNKHFIAAFFIFGEWVLLSAFSLFFASFTTPLLHSFFLVGISFLGHWSYSLHIFAINTKNLWLQKILNTIYYILPNFEALNFREEALYNITIDSAMIFESAAVLFLWICTALVAANLIFCRRKLI